ncbi:MAG: DUF2339 domain-containing protein [Candidatus Melainabacteria bacterium]|nr:DUF2339 domain-containing protein [Candidatus Melainabacteria bacterium]
MTSAYNTSDEPLKKPEGNAAEPGSANSLEVWLGTHLNKIGVVFLVCGLALLIVNQFQHFTALIKIITGLISGCSLIAAGLWFEKKSKLPVYGYALSAGGWALSYFTAYAAHHIESVRIINSPVIGLLLLLSISYGAVLHFLRLRSEIITTISLSLAFLTTCFSTVSLFTLISSVVLVGSLVFIVAKMRWYGLFAAGVVASYAIYCFFLLPNVVHDPWIQSLGYSAAQSKFWLTIGFSSLLWGAFMAALFALDETTKSKKVVLISATTVNCVAYTTAVLGAMDVVYPEKRFAFVLSLALAYLISASRGMRAVLPGVSTIHTLFALFLFSLAVPLHFTQQWISSIWLMEVPLLAWIGIKHGLPAYTRFAGVLAAASFVPLACHDIWRNTVVDNSLPGLEIGTIIGILGTAAYAAAFACHRFLQKANGLCSRSYFLMASLTSACLVMRYCDTDWMPLAFIAGGGMVALTGFKIGDVFTRRLGEFSIACAGIPLAYLSGNTVLNLLAAAAILVIDRGYRSYNGDRISYVRIWFVVQSLLVIGVQTNRLLDTAGVAAPWAVAVPLILMIGFKSQDKVYRIAGLTLGALAGVAYLAMPSFFAKTSFLDLPYKEVSALLLIAGSAVGASSYYNKDNREMVGRLWTAGFIGCTTCGYLILQNLFSFTMPHAFLPATYAAAALIPLSIGIVTSHPSLRALGWFSALTLPFLSLGLPLADWNLGGTLLLSIVLYGFYYLFKHLPERDQLEENLEHGFSALATLLVAAAIAQHGGKFMTLLWALQGLTVLTTGFASKDKPFRIYGLSLLALVCGKLILVDMASMQMGYRIMSFIAVGIVLLITSYFYVRFPGRADGAERGKGDCEPEQDITETIWSDAR